jgi:hypothetical protein
MCDISRIAVSYSEYIERSHVVAFKFFFKPSIAISIPTITTAIIIQFMFVFLHVSIHKLVNFSFFVLPSA